MRQHFDLDPELIFLNSGTQSICPRAVLESVQNYQRNYERNPTVGLFEAIPMLWEVQQIIADFFHARPQDIFLRSNVTLALNTFLLGIPLPPRSEIVVTDLEYGAVANICRLRAEREGHQLRILELPQQTQEDLVARIVAQLKPETGMLLVSHVMTGTGLVLPLKELARETRNRGILLVVDGAHAPGAVPLAFSELADVDFYGGNLHKWMMGPKGTAFGWVPERHQESLQLTQGGWTSFEYPESFKGFGEGHRFAGRMLTPGCLDYAPFFGLFETFKFWRHQHESAVRERIYQLQKHLEKGLQSGIGWQTTSPPPGPYRGPLLSYSVPPALANLGGGGYGLMNYLYRECGLQIIMTQVRGEWKMRFSPHVYNEEGELDEAVEILADLCRA